MKISTFVPSESNRLIASNVFKHQVFAASGWRELDSHLAKEKDALAIIDPSAEGFMNIQAATAIITRYRCVPVVGFVTVTGANLKAIARLSKIGLAEVLVTGPYDTGQKLRELVRAYSEYSLPYALLTCVEARLGTLPPPLLRAVQDLFERPHRYEAALDLGYQSNLSTKQVYSAMKKAGLGTPRKLVTVARIVRAFVLLSQREETVRTISTRVGYANPRLFTQKFTEVLGYPPTVLPQMAKYEEVIRPVFEWLQKPTSTSRRNERTFQRS